MFWSLLLPPVSPPILVATSRLSRPCAMLGRRGHGRLARPPPRGAVRLALRLALDRRLPGLHARADGLVALPRLHPVLDREPAEVGRAGQFPARARRSRQPLLALARGGARQAPRGIAERRHGQSGRRSSTGTNMTEGWTLAPAP